MIAFLNLLIGINVRFEQFGETTHYSNFINVGNKTLKHSLAMFPRLNYSDDFIKFQLYQNGDVKTFGAFAQK